MASDVQIIISAKDLASMTLKNFQGTINRTVRSVERFAATANYVALRAGIALAGIGMGAKHLLTVASEAEELDNVMQESFEHMRDSVESWAVSTAQAMNRSTYQMREFVGLNQALLRPMIGDIAKATEMSKTLAALAVDMASFWNVEDKEVFEALQSGIVGLVRPLRRFGIDLTEAALKQYALNKGINKAVEEMTQAEKAMLRFDFIMERTIIQQGDAVRTAGSYQNQLKGLQGDIRNLTEEMGKLLLPMGAEVLRNVRDLVKWFRDLDTETKTQIVRWAAIGSAVLGGVVAFGMVVTAINVVVKGFATLASLIGIFTSPMVLGIGLLIAAVAGLYTAWEQDWGGIRSLIEDILAYLDELKEKITDSKAWKWTVDVAIPAIAEGAQMVIKAVVEVAGKMYEAIKKGFATGDWSDFWLITADTWRKGVLIGVALSGAVQGINIVKDAIIKGLGLVTTALGVPGALGAISVLIQLKEAMVLNEQGMESAYKDFAQNVLIAALAGVLTGLAFDAKLGMWVFTIAVNLKLGNVFETSLQNLGEKASDWFLQKEADMTGISFDVLKQKEKIIDEYVQYREDWYKEATKDMGWLEAFLFRAKTIHEGLMNLEEWLQELYGMTFEQYMNLGKPQPEQKGWGDFLRETRGYHEGAILPGKSGPDQFLAMVAPGEAIVPSKVVNAGWRAVLDWFRSKGVPGFQTGYVPNIRTGNPEFDASLRSTGNWLNNLSEGLNDIFRVIKDGFVNFFSFIGDFLIRLAEKFFPEQVKDLREFWSNLVERWNKIINAKPFEAEPGLRPWTNYVETRPPTFLDTWREGLKGLLEQYKDWDSHIQNLAKTTAQALANTFADFFVDVFKGEMKDLGDYINSFLETIIRAFSNAMAQMITQKMMYGLFGMGATALPFNPMNTLVGGGLFAGDALFLQARAKGGPYRPGALLVGEEGPELMLTRHSGTVVSNGDLANLGRPAEVVVNLINEGGPKIKEVRKDVKVDAKRTIVNLIYKAAEENTDNFRDFLFARG